MQIYIPEVNPPIEHDDISDFRTTALLNVEGKLFLTLVSRHLETHLINNNNFINNLIQNVCMEEVSGCWEHISIVWAALIEAKSKKLYLATIWLDIANAYQSILHKLTLQWYGLSLNGSMWNFSWLHSFYNPFLSWYEYNSRICF